ncbi:hypothetical protein SDC9_75901 [bioreactor metagenome]|uniref:Uncharacterized protein n=1 Tax=bioreactor metagenome TaxID=1076179 RepID=A0A644YNB3_9ZZZZ
MKRSVWKAMVAPCIIIILLSAYLAVFGIGILMTPAGFLFKLLMCGVPAAGIAALLYVLYQRYTEIKGGNEDDLDNY